MNSRVVLLLSNDTYNYVNYSYAGPGSQKVTQQFKIDWSTYLSSSESVIVAFIDGRGTAAQGDQHLYDVYKRLGTVEVQDQLTAIR